jgi:hypothetical protein
MDDDTRDDKNAHPFDLCACSRCGPPWRNERPEPDEFAQHADDATEWAEVTLPAAVEAITGRTLSPEIIHKVNAYTWAGRRAECTVTSDFLPSVQGWDDGVTCLDCLSARKETP